MITERTLKKWRKEALLENSDYANLPPDAKDHNALVYINELHSRILRMTQELMDLHLIKRGK